MYESGCRWIFYGIESGSEEMQKRIHKPINRGLLLDTLQKCCRSGIAPLCSFVLGFPDETQEQLRATATLIKDIKDYANFSVFFFSPYYGTELYEELEKAGRIEKIDSFEKLSSSIWKKVKDNYSSVSTREIKVVKAYTLFWSITANNVSDSSEEGNHTWITIKNEISNVFQNGVKKIIPNIWDKMVLACSLLFNLFCFPKIKKTYGLTLSGKTK